MVVTTARASAPTVTDHQHAHAVRLDEHGHAYDVVSAAHGPTACHSDSVYATTYGRLSHTQNILRTAWMCNSLKCGGARYRLAPSARSEYA